MIEQTISIFVWIYCEIDNIVSHWLHNIMVRYIPHEMLLHPVYKYFRVPRETFLAM